MFKKRRYLNSVKLVRIPGTRFRFMAREHLSFFRGAKNDDEEEIISDHTIG